MQQSRGLILPLDSSPISQSVRGQGVYACLAYPLGHKRWALRGLVFSSWIPHLTLHSAFHGQTAQQSSVLWLG